MFPPDADVAPHELVSSTKILPSRGDPKAIKYNKTRLPEQDEHVSSGMSEPPSPTRSRIEAAIAGTPCKFTVIFNVLNQNNNIVRRPTPLANK